MMHIVDDNETVLDVMGEIVQTFGYRTRQFSSPRDYLRYASSDEYQLPKAVLTDVMMPEMDGFTLMKKVRAMHPEVRFVVISGEDHSEQEGRQGACIYLRKPIHFDKLESTFEHLRQCINCGPSIDLSSSLNDDRRHFGICATRCPFMADDQKN